MPDIVNVPFSLAEDQFEAKDGETDTLEGGGGEDTALLATDRDEADSTNSVENL